MIELPFCESFISHNRGDLNRLAQWLFEHLDSKPPDEGGGFLTLYLCYHSADDEYFAASDYVRRLAEAVLGIYEKEEKWNGQGFGDLRFELSGNAGNSSVITLLPQKRKKTGLFRRFRRNKEEPRVRETGIEFCLLNANDFVKAGTVGVVSRWNNPLKWEDVLTAKLIVSDRGKLARHLENWQREAHWLQSAVYFPRGRKEITIGDLPGCDIYTTALPAPLAVEYNSATNEWIWSFPTAPYLSSGSAKETFEFDYAADSSSSAGTAGLSLRGKRFETQTRLADVEEENQMPLFTIEIVGCVLPLPHPRGYGVISDDFPLKWLPDASSALRLPGENWLYLRGAGEQPFLLCRGESGQGQLLQDGRRVSLPPDKESFGRKQQRECLWRNDSLMQGKNFRRGELEFFPPIRTRLKIGAASGVLPDEMFINYSDGLLGRAPVNFLTSDGKSYNLQFNQSARHPIFLLDEKTKQLVHFDPDKTKRIEIGGRADFILGATHYRLSHFYRSRRQ
ncbi:MAG TPA: hypothetical protein VF721_08925 [Pyrinomonadaceae bacterium]|jgi:hypothetical protein